MKQTVPTILAAILILFSLALPPLSSETRPPQPQTLPLECAEGDCPLLDGIPQTAGMRSGFVRLKPQASVGWHTTGQNEEALVILRGRGEALIEGQPGRAFAAPMLVYIPPATRHNVTNTGDAPLEYVYVVAPAATVKDKSKGKAQNANGKATAAIEMIRESRSWDFTFAFCDLRFAF